VGKSTALAEAADRLRERGLAVGGLRSPEVRKLGQRVGFRLVDLGSDAEAVMAHVDRKAGPSVGKYRVDVNEVDRVSEAALARAIREDDVILVDEIAPMETYSDAFVARVREAIDASTPVIGTIHQQATSGVIGEIKQRPEVDVVEITRENRHGMPGKLVDRVVDALDTG